MIDPTQIETRYAKSGDLNIAYQQFGDGAVDLVMIPGWASHVEQSWALPEYAAFLRKLAAFARVILIDRRGTGLSDPVTRMPTLEERMDDVRAVLDDAGVERAAILGISEGGPMAMLFAASSLERVAALILYGTFARLTRAEDYPAGVDPKAGREFIDGVEGRWGKGKSAEIFAPSRAADSQFVRAWGRFERNSVGPGAMKRLLEINLDTDVRDVLPSIHVPTLVLHRVGDWAMPVSLGRYLAENIPGAKYIELPGEDHFFATGDVDTPIGEIREFLTGERAVPEPDRILTTILFADIVQSTEKATELGDRAWKDLLERFYAAVRDTLAQYRGRLVDTAGDGLFASFDGPARAIRCGLVLARAAESLGIKLRVGVHTGECEVFDDKFSGIAVHLGARIAAEAEPGETLVSSTVKDLVAGSGVRFEDRGEHSLKGIPETWRLFHAEA